MGAFDVRYYTDPETKEYSYWYNTKLDTQPPAGLITLHVADCYLGEITLIEKQQKKQKLHLQDIELLQFLLGMSQTYHDLTILGEPDLFVINNNQKHILNQLIHFALKNWDACQIYYHVCRCSAIKKNSPFCFVPRSWKKVNPPAYSTDYVQNTCDKTNLKPKANASSTTQKNN